MQNTMKGHSSFINVGGVMDLVFCMLSDDVVVYIKFHKNISKGFRIIEQTLFLY